MNEQLQVILESLSVVFISPVRDPLAGLVWCVFLGVLGAWLYLSCRRKTLGKAIRTILDAGCDSPETAKTKEELFPAKKAPRVLDSRERMIASAVGEDGVKRYYLPENCREKAAYFLKAGKTPVFLVLLEIAGLYALLVALYYILPPLLESFSA